MHNFSGRRESGHACLMKPVLFSLTGDSDAQDRRAFKGEEILNNMRIFLLINDTLYAELKG